MIAIISKKKYPQYRCFGQVSKELRKDIITRVKGLLICNISTVTYTTFDSIILGKLLGLNAVAIYNNYIVIFAAVEAVIRLIRNSMQASVGNSIAQETTEKNYNDMLLWQFLFSIIATVCTTCLLCLFQPFMSIWMGEDMLLPFRDVVLISLWFFVTVIQHAYFLYLTGNGLWLEMKWSYVGCTAFNICFNVLLGYFLGTTGIIVSSMLSSLFFSLIWQSVIIIKKYFQKSPKQFFIKQLLYFAVAGLCVTVSYFTCCFIPLDGVWGLIIKLFISLFIPMIIMIAAYFKTNIFKRALAFTKNVIKVRH